MGINFEKNYTFKAFLGPLLVFPRIPVLNIILFYICMCMKIGRQNRSLLPHHTNMISINRYSTDLNSRIFVLYRKNALMDLILESTRLSLWYLSPSMTKTMKAHLGQCYRARSASPNDGLSRMRVHRVAGEDCIANGFRINLPLTHWQACLSQGDLGADKLLQLICYI